MANSEEERRIQEQRLIELLRQGKNSQNLDKFREIFPKNSDSNVNLAKLQEGRNQDKHDLEMAEREYLLELRERIAPWIVAITACYLFFVAAVVAFAGFGFWNFFLDDSVLIALLTSTTVTVLGLIIIILKSLFPNDSKLK